jgi:hypothetical protein
MSEELENLQLLEELPMEEPNPEAILDDGIVNALTIAAEAINELMDMSATVRRHGVSQQDMKALVAVQSRCAAAGLVLSPSASMEGFQGFYTEERSLTNRQASLESIGKVIADTIKAWLRKLVDLVADGYRWVTGLKHKHALLEAKLEKVRAVILEYRTIYNQMVVLAHTVRFQSEEKECSAKVIFDAKLENTDLTLYGFNQKDQVSALKAIHTKSLDAADEIGKRVKVLRETLDKDENVSDDASNGSNDLAAVVNQAEKMREIKDFSSYITDALGDGWWDDTKRLTSVAVINYDPLFKAYGECANELRKLQGVKLTENHGGDVTHVQAVIDGVTCSVNQLNSMITFMNSAALSQVAALKVHYAFYTEASTRLVAEFKKTNASAEVRQAFNEQVNLISKLKV